MAMSCFLSKLTHSQSLLQGQSLKAITNKFLRTSSILSNNYLSNEKFLQQKSGSLTPVSSKLFTQTPAVSPLNRYVSTTPTPQSDHQGHSHVALWRLERILSAALLPIIPIGLLYPSQVWDTCAAILIVMHAHWGLEAIVIDYIRPIIFGTVVAKVALVLLYVFSIVTLAGLLNLIYNDLGLANAFYEIWKKK